MAYAGQFDRLSGLFMAGAYRQRSAPRAVISERLISAACSSTTGEEAGLLRGRRGQRIGRPPRSPPGYLQTAVSATPTDRPLAPDHSPGAKSFLKLGLFSSTTGEEAGVAVAGVAGVRSLQGELVTNFLWDLTPVLRRRSAGAGEHTTCFFAVLQTGEGADRVGVGGTQALTPLGQALAVDLPGASRAGRPAEQDRGGEHGRRCGS
jgi:hypothetical protein